jgi:hypothetical protein
MIVSGAGYTLHLALAKEITADIHPVFLAFWRSFLAFLFASPFIFLGMVKLHTARFGALVTRSLIGSAGKDLKTDLGPMEIGGLVTSMATTQLDTKRLGGRPFDRDGISYWEADWPKADSAVDAANGGAGSVDGGSNRYKFLF